MKKIVVPEKDVVDFIPQDFGGKREEKTACVVRYGGFGDMLQVASILPLLKEQGYRVCVNVTERGEDICKSDPSIDEILVQRTDQISIDRLTEYWEKLSPCFDKFVQLSESIEGSLLLVGDRIEKLNGVKTKVPGNPNFYSLTKEEVHEMCNINYMERIHDIAGVPYVFNPRFFSTKEEKDWAKKARKRIKSRHVILWALSGSSVHKVYPWTDTVISKVLSLRNDVSFVTIGDELCKLLESGWENEKRVITKSGEWGIRNTLSFLPHCSIVIGPETGVLNAASSLDSHKIVLLSHSSKENLSKHWKNTTSLEPDYYDNFCFPCHKMHYGFDTCNRDNETGGAMCAAKIKPTDIYKDILKNLK